MGTIRSDDPLLTRRGKNKDKGPFYRIILDTGLNINENAGVLRPAQKHSTIIAVSNKIKKNKKQKLLQEKGVEILYCRTPGGRIDLKYLLSQLGRMNITKLIVEGGSEVNYSFLKEGLVDRVILFMAPKLLGGAKARGWIGGKGFLLDENKKVEKGEFINILKNDFIFNGYMK